MLLRRRSTQELLNLWKQTIDSLDPILGRTYPDRPWHPRDGRITELGMHVAVDPAAGNEIVVGIAASYAGDAANAPLVPERKIVYRSYGICVANMNCQRGHPQGRGVRFSGWLAEVQLSTDEAKTPRDALDCVLDEDHWKAKRNSIGVSVIPRNMEKVARMRPCQLM